MWVHSYWKCHEMDCFGAAECATSVYTLHTFSRIRTGTSQVPSRAGTLGHLGQRSDFFFWAHAVHAQGSDGHQNVLSLISYSHILENRWKQKARCLPQKTKTNPTKNKAKQHKTKQPPPTKNKTRTPQEDTQETRWDTTLSENPQAAQYFSTMW